MSTFEQTPTSQPGGPAPFPAVVELAGRVAPDLVGYVRRKVGGILAHTGRAALQAHVRIVRHCDPARERPVTARASVRLAGATLHVHAEGVTARETTDLLLDRLDQRIARISRTRRGDRCTPTPTAPHPADAASASLQTQHDDDAGDSQGHDRGRHHGQPWT